ncbi:exonuclease SbcCD subunit D [Jatrophihabitans sp.]|uniref:exonuclease SbcCD subunit D n=1 Tax=Jatrophihabitans sp. TaxID=1932789 RepID=UPI0030C720FA|nr:Nuclease SbcCD subunit [Jatrophihabitans sp.]
MARFLHTSDWHLGRSLHGTSLLEHQQVFLEWLVAEAVNREVDAVLVAGDVYDRAVPPSDAVRLLDRALAGFALAGVPVVVSSGNHDSAVRLGFGASLASAARVYLRTQLRDLLEPVVVDGGGVGVYAIPYLLPDAVMAELGCERSHTGVLTAAVDRIRTDAAARGLAHTVVLAHAFVTGGSASDSERDISVGGIGDVAASVFAGIDYVALGHLHGAQQVAPGVRYSGSPLPFSFSERHHHKSVVLVEVDARGVRTELVPTPVPHPMHELRGNLAELLALSPGPPADSWLKVVLTDVHRPAAPMEQLRERWPNTVILDHRPPVELGSSAEDLARLRQAADPVEVCSLFVEWVDSTYPDGRQRDELASVVEAVRHTERSA